MLKGFCHIIGAAALALSLAAPAQAQTKYNLTLSGASPEGLWSLLGAGTNSAIAAAYPGSTVTYQTSGGGLANVAIVSNGNAELGIVHNIELAVAVAGKPPFKQPIESLRAIAYLYNWAPMQMVMTKAFADEHGITSMEDLAAKKPPVRIAVNQRGNMVQEMNKQILSAYGISYEDIESWGGQVVYSPGAEQGNLMADRRIDMIGNGVFVPYGYFVQVSKVRDLVMLPLNEDVIKQVAAETGADPYTVKAGGYEWLDKDVRTVALGAILVADARMSDEDAYNITKALVEGVDKIRGVHKAMADLTPELMAAQNVIPYHDGALRYFKEAGLR